MRFYIDNQPVKFCLRRGRCKAGDVNKLLLIGVDAISRSGMVPDFKWVPSAWSIGDRPSRGTAIEGVRCLDCSRTVRKIVEEASSC